VLSRDAVIATRIAGSVLTCVSNFRGLREDMIAWDQGHLTNGAFSPVQADPSKSTWTGPVSDDPVTITATQHVGATDALRTGSYTETLTFTPSTTTP
jgi:hypothetical protein